MRAESAPPAYTLIDLGYLTGGSGNASGTAINALGQVAGVSNYNSFGDMHAFRYSGTKPPADLGDLDGFVSAAFGINRSGQVVGESDNADGDTHAFRTAANAPITAASDLGTLGGFSSTARGINTNGVVTGWSETDSGATHAFRTAGNVISAGDDLGTLGGSADFSRGMGINSAGQITGVSTVIGNAQHAFRTTATGGIDVASDLGILPGGTNSFGSAINDTGQVAGFGDVSGVLHAFRSSGNGAGILTLTDLGTLGGSSQGFGIDSLGNVVGASNGSAFLYTDLSIYDLNNYLNAASKQRFPTWRLTAANAINDSGFITGYATDANSLTHAFLLMPDLSSPTPEPGSFALLIAFGLTGTGIFRRYRKRS